MEIERGEIVRFVLLLVFLLSVYWIYQTFTEPRIPKLDSSVVSFSRNISFGATVNAASKELGSGKDLVINLDDAKKEIDLVSDLGADLVRFDIERQTLEKAEEMGKLDEAIAYARSKKKKIYFSYLGRESWIGSSEGAGKSNWENFKKEYKNDVNFITGRYRPDFILVMPECPYEIGRQVNSKRTFQEWYDFSKEVGMSIKQISFSTKVALEGTMLSGGEKSIDKDFAEMVLGSNDVAINIFSMNARSSRELEEGKENLLNMKKKYRWDGELWMGNVDSAFGGDAQKQKDFLLYAIHLTKSKGFSGIVLGQIRDSAENKNGIAEENYSPKNSYAVIKEVMANRK